MEIELARKEDMSIIYGLMQRAFMKYKYMVPSSSALNETLESITADFQRGEKSFIAYKNEAPVGMVRFQMEEDILSFYRLSVLPEQQGQGIGMRLIIALEEYAKENSIQKLSCKVRMTVKENLHLYEQLGFQRMDEESIDKPGGIQLNVVTMEKEI